MLPVNPGGHAAYQNFVVTNLRKYYPDPDAFSRATWDIIERFWNLDLSYTDELLRSKYSVFGPKPRTPSCMQRSYLLSIDFKVHSLTDWAAQLKINPLYAILSGFEFGDTPGVGTFYDFLSQVCLRRSTVRFPASVPFMIFSAGFGILKIPISLPIYVLQKRKGLKSLLIKALKPNLSKRFPLISYWSSWKQPLLY